MAATLRLELQGDSSNWTVDVEGTWLPSLEAEYKTASNPPEIIGLREVWEFQKCRLVGGPGVQATVTAALFTKWLAMRSRIATRGTAFPTYARLVIPGGSTVHTLGPSTHEGFVVERIGGEADPDNPAATNRQTMTFTLVVSGVQRFADTNGIVGWSQEVDSSYPDGRHRLEWRTRITTIEGVSAADKARSYAALDVSALGGTYLYETGSSSGAVDIVESDADEQNSRVPTVVEAVSRVRAFGVTLGAVTAGTLTEVTYSVRTSITATERTTTTVATAKGSGALQFVMSKEPVQWNAKDVVDEQGLMTASGTWTQTDTTGGGSGSGSDKKKDAKEGTKVTVSGGQREPDYEPVADGGDPVEFVSSFVPMVAVVEVSLEATGVDGSNDSMPLPGDPGDPWRFDAGASAEGAPFVKEPAATIEKTRWGREARLTFRCGAPPEKPIHVALEEAEPRASWCYR